MPNTKYVDGSVWGNKKIVSYFDHNKYGQPRYLWECILCGNSGGPSTGTDVSRSPWTKCCPRKREQKKNYYGHGIIDGKRFARYKHSATRRGLEFDLDAVYLAEVWKAQGGRCALSGLEIDFDGSASLDRIDSRLGYVRGNVQWLHMRVNEMKSSMDEKEFINLCSLIASRKDKNDKDAKQVDAQRPNEIESPKGG